MQEALAIAREHIDWAERSGLNPRVVIRSLGMKLGDHDGWRPTWGQAIAAVATAWIEMQGK